MRRTWVCMMMGLALSLAGPARSQPLQIPPVGTQPGPEGDAVWNPTVEQLKKWVDDGVGAAAAETELSEVPAIKHWTWSNAEGIPIDLKRKLRFVIAVTPQVVATVTGYEAAWREDVWQRLQENREAVVADLTVQVKSAWRPTQLVFLMGAEGSPETAGTQVAVWWPDGWGSFSVLSAPLKGLLGLSPCTCR